MATDLRFINAALTRIGDEPLTSLTGTSAAAKVANQNYEHIVETALASHPWKFATKYAQLTLVSTDDPPDPWTYVYQVPTDMLDLRSVKVSDTPMDYEQASDKIFCNVSEDDDLIAAYTWRVPEADWPRWFSEAVTTALEAIFLRAIAEDYEKADIREKAAVRMLARAKFKDSQRATTKNPVTSPTLRARVGLPGRVWPNEDR